MRDIIIMFFTYIVLSIGMYSLERQKPQVVEVFPVEEVQVVKSKPKKSEPVIADVEEIQEENVNDAEIQDAQNLWEEIEDFDPELYEEISFEDNFDEEYRNDVGDSYFEYPEDEEINIPKEIEEE